MLASLSGANLIHDVGFLDHCSVTSYEMMVLADEVIGSIVHITQEIVVDADELALDLINQVGPGGHFMAEDHTMERFRSWWEPTLIDRSADTVEEDVTTLGERIRVTVREIFETHPTKLAPIVKTTNLVFTHISVHVGARA